MRNISIGTDQISVKDAIRRVRHNINDLQRKLTEVPNSAYFSNQLQCFYQRKLDTQKATLEWLERAR